ncbi:SURF1 family protein [Roseateles sp. BYS180W]|uniref:SURF1-like protein n=1 Tax=Roseateles rivi TaxID=3299028 RepID=A0ABW7FRK5_9BURK
MTGAVDAGPRARRRWLLWAALALCATLAACFTSLGVWQLQRLAWKQDLIQRLEHGLKAQPVALPLAGPTPAKDWADWEYRRVVVQGVLDHERERHVHASTVLGSGYWVMTPLRVAEDRWVWVNRGFVPVAWRDPVQRREAGHDPLAATQGLQRLEGLVRLTEPAGSRLQANLPQERRWYSRDVQTLSASAQAPSIAPVFVELWPGPQGQQQRGATQEALAELGGRHVKGPWPYPGLTVLRFSNNHRMYALTWFALALMCAGAMVWLVRDARRPPTTS